MLPAELNELVEAALALRQQQPCMPARDVLDTVMHSPPGSRWRADAALQHEAAWLAPLSAWAEMLREAFAPEVEGDYLQLLQDPDPEVRTVLEELWGRTVVRRFRRRYLGDES